MSNVYAEIAQATIEACSLIDGGAAPTDATIKVARDYDLNFHKINRLVEAVNTAQQISIIRSEDRRQEFSVADPFLVKKALLKTEDPLTVEKRAFASYDPDKDYYAEHIAYKYFSHADPEPLVKHSTTTHSDVVDEIHKLEKLADSALHKYAAIHHEFLDELAALPKKEAELKSYLDVACALHGRHPLAEKTANFIWQAKTKKTFTPEDVHDLIEDTEKYAAFKKLCDYMNGMEVLSNRVSNFESIAKAARYSLCKINDMGNPLRVEDDFYIESDHRKQQRKAAALQEKLGAGLGSLLLPAMGKAITGLGKKRKELGKASPGSATAKKFLKSVDAASMLNKIMQEDEIIREFPRKDVVSAFNTLRSVSERSALNKSIATAWLRRLLTHPDSVTAEDFEPFRRHERDMLEAELIEKGKGSPLREKKE